MINDHSQQTPESVDLSTLPRERMTPRTRTMLMTIREALIMLLNALDDYLGRERTLERRQRK